jgi:hypothetical protein
MSCSISYFHRHTSEHNLNLKAPVFFKTTVIIYQTIRSNIPEHTVLKQSFIFVFIVFTKKFTGSHGNTWKQTLSTDLQYPSSTPLSYLYVTPNNYNYIISDHPALYVLLCQPLWMGASGHMHVNHKQRVSALIRSYEPSYRIRKIIQYTKAITSINLRFRPSSGLSISTACKHLTVGREHEFKRAS